MEHLFRFSLKYPHREYKAGHYEITAKTKQSATNVWNKAHPDFALNFCAFRLVKKNVEHEDKISYKPFKEKIIQKIYGNKFIQRK